MLHNIHPQPANSGVAQTLHTATLHAQPRGTWAVAVLALCLGSACSSDGKAATDGEDAGGTSKGLGKKVAGPCATTQISATGKIFKHVIDYVWDTDGQLIEEKSGPGATELGADIYAKRWGYDVDGKLLAEFYETTGNEPNYNWTYTYDANGQLATRKGTDSSYGTVDCTYEQLTGTKDYNLLCNFAYDEKDNEGNVTGTVKGTFGIQYIYGMQQITELRDDGKGGTPSQVTRRFDTHGNLTAIEIDSSLQGYPEHITAFTYDDKNQMTTKTVDSDADGTVELTTVFTYDSYGNALKAVTTVTNIGLDHTMEQDYSCW